MIIDAEQKTRLMSEARQNSEAPRRYLLFIKILAIDERLSKAWSAFYKFSSKEITWSGASSPPTFTTCSSPVS